MRHPKTARLVIQLQCPRYAAVGLLETLWHFTAMYTPRGDIGRYSDAELEYELGWDGAPGRLVDAFITAGFLDAHPTYRLVVHDWHEHADQAVQRLLARQGETFVTLEKKKRKLTSQRLAITSLARGSGKGSSSLSSGEREPEREGPPRSRADLTAAFETRFWPAYPPRNGRRDGKQDALTEWLKLKPDAALEATILAALPAYAASTDFPKDACRWLKGRRWADETVAVPDAGAGRVRQMAAAWRAKLAAGGGA